MFRPSVNSIGNLLLIGTIFVLGVSLDEGEENPAYDPSKAKYPGKNVHDKSLLNRNV